MANLCLNWFIFKNKHLTQSFCQFNIWLSLLHFDRHSCFALSSIHWSVNICTYSFTHNIVKMPLSSRQHRFSDRGAVATDVMPHGGTEPGWADWTQSQRPGNTFFESIAQRCSSWILSACAHACVYVFWRLISLDWVLLKQPDSLIFLGRFRPARAYKGVYNKVTIYLSNVREIKWFPRLCWMLPSYFHTK